MVASDRISTYDAVHPTPIPDKGKVLTGLSVFWFEQTARHRRPTISSPPPRACPTRCAGGRSSVRKLEMLPGRVRRARLHHGLWLEGLPGDRRGLGDRAARRGCASPSSCPSRSSRRRPRPRWATTRRSTSTGGRARRRQRADGARARRLDRAVLVRRRARARAWRDPRRHEVRVRARRRTASWWSATRC